MMKKYSKLLVGLLVGLGVGLLLRPYLSPRHSSARFLSELSQIGNPLPEGCVEMRSGWNQGLRGSSTAVPRIWRFYQRLDISQTKELSEGYKPIHSHHGREHDLIDRISEHYEAQLSSVFGTLDHTVIDNSYNSSFAAFSTYPEPCLLTLYTLIDPFADDPRRVHVFVFFTVTTGFD